MLTSGIPSWNDAWERIGWAAEDSAPVFDPPSFSEWWTVANGSPPLTAKLVLWLFCKEGWWFPLRWVCVLEMKGHGVWQKLNQK
jgi:hypothetical protein